jgi:hypothetical protein
MLDDMRMRKLAPKTQSGYLRAVQRFAGFLGRAPSRVTAEDLRQFQLSLVDAGLSPTALNGTLSGLKFFLEVDPRPCRAGAEAAPGAGAAHPAGGVESAGGGPPDRRGRQRRARTLGTRHRGKHGLAGSSSAP